MCEAKKERRQVLRVTSLAASSVLLSTILLAGCASVGDALNPVEWYKGIFGSSDSAASAKAESSDDSEFPKIRDDKRPDVASTQERAALSKGLAADHSNAKYTQEVLRREGNPTLPLSVEASVAPTADATPAATPSTPVSSPVLSKQPASVPTTTSAPVPAPEPVVTALEPAAPVPASTPVPAKQEQSSAAPLPAAPDVAAVPAAPAVAVDDEPPPPPPKLSTGGVVPAPAAAAASVSTSSAASAPAAASAAPAAAALAPVQVASAVPAMTAPATVAPAATSVEEVYRRRLAEFSAGTAPAAAPAAGTAAAAPVAAATSAAATNDAAQGPVLIPPAEYRRKLAHDNGGARPLEAFDGSRSAASFEVATVRFGEGTAELSAGEMQHLKDVAALYREKGGQVRVLGRSASPRLEIDATANQQANRQLAGGRAAAIARELIKLGVPAHKIFAGAAPALLQASAPVSATNGETTEIYIDY